MLAARERRPAQALGAEATAPVSSRIASIWPGMAQKVEIGGNGRNARTDQVLERVSVSASTAPSRPASS
jgi:hypothetical protein